MSEVPIRALFECPAHPWPVVVHSTGNTPGPCSIYYECIRSTDSGASPWVVMIHGDAHTGACFQYTV